jgi:hypothetical protein
MSGGAGLEVALDPESKNPSEDHLYHLYFFIIFSVYTVLPRPSS